MEEIGKIEIDDLDLTVPEPKGPLEADLFEPVKTLLEADGWKVFRDPGGGDFFDIACYRGNGLDAEVLLVELKLTDWFKLYQQAVVRRIYGDYVAVAMPKMKHLERIKQADKKGNIGIILVADWGAEWKRKPSYLTKTHIRAKKRRDRISATLQAVDQGLSWGKAEGPSATFMEQRTESLWGVPLWKFMKDWPKELQELMDIQIPEKPSKPVERKTSTRKIRSLDSFIKGSGGADLSGSRPTVKEGK